MGLEINQRLEEFCKESNISLEAQQCFVIKRGSLKISDKGTNGVSGNNPALSHTIKLTRWISFTTFKKAPIPSLAPPTGIHLSAFSADTIAFGDIPLEGISAGPWLFVFCRFRNVKTARNRSVHFAFCRVVLSIVVHIGKEGEYGMRGGKDGSLGATAWTLAPRFHNYSLKWKTRMGAGVVTNSISGTAMPLYRTYLGTTSDLQQREGSRAFCSSPERSCGRIITSSTSRYDPPNLGTSSSPLRTKKSVAAIKPVP
jgi:hypothetical protein